MYGTHNPFRVPLIIIDTHTPVYGSRSSVAMTLARPRWYCCFVRLHFYKWVISASVAFIYLSLYTFFLFIRERFFENHAKKNHTFSGLGSHNQDWQCALCMLDELDVLAKVFLLPLCVQPNRMLVGSIETRDNFGCWFYRFRSPLFNKSRNPVRPFLWSCNFIGVKLSSILCKRKILCNFHLLLLCATMAQTRNSFESQRIQCWTEPSYEGNWCDTHATCDRDARE